MPRDRELIMDIEVAGRSFTNKEEKLLVTSIAAKPIIHFRRHPKWIEYMNGTIDGTTPTTKDDLLYGFDWLGDEHYDFGKTNTLTDRKGRYNYLFNNVNNSLSNPNTNSGSKIEKLIHDRSYNSVETLSRAKTNLKNVFKQGAKTNTIHNKEYFPAWMALKYNQEVKICLGLRNENLSTAPQFGDNDDTIHLIPETGYANAFTISPKQIKKADLVFGSVEITLKCIKPTNKNISIIAYHTDGLTPKEADGSINIQTKGAKVGELRMMKNNEHFFLNMIIVKVKQRNNHFNSGFGAFTSQAKVEKVLQRGLGQGMITCFFSTDIIDKDDSGNRLKKSTDASLGSNVGNYNNYINNQYLYKNYVAKTATDNTTNGTSISAVNYANFKANKAAVKTPFETKKQFLLFMHDYSHTVGTSQIKGAADDLDTPQINTKGKWASIFDTADKQTLIHETAHTLGLPHTFNIYTDKTNKINFYPLIPVGAPSQTIDIFISRKKAVYFKTRHSNAQHLFIKGSTENIMDYPQKDQWNENNVTHARRAVPIGRVANAANCLSRPTIYRAGSEKDFYEKGTEIPNLKKRISFWQWQWQMMQADDEIITRELITQIEPLPLNPIVPLKTEPITAEIPDIKKKPIKIN
ncbi:hypothetical protein [Psychroserpens sp. NJDZ02]|uniref:hypothetical protein n=1 Tax=Psychroserpens sp. NJDZ02 TaxID=2570561 RepID=UPI0010A91D5E|nr:hypothetical protein [Psychroserpens sp. NJDZ02]QCE43149.1 hypothetical protein E9099_17560 [Psychroserpens sp. NJDZ02]